MSNNIEDKYQILSEIEHVLLRPGVYLGNMHHQMGDYRLYKPSDNKIVTVQNTAYNEGLLKLFDEIITNSVDERVRASRLFDINEIRVHVSESGEISVQDDGGIPVVLHKVTGVYLPRMIFGMLKTSANYGKDGDRTGAGLNGLGSKLTNIFSTKFRVETCDGKEYMDIQWSNNMRTIDHEERRKSSEHWTKTTFQIELDRFEMERLDLSTIRIMQKRCIDAAAANPGLKIVFSSDAVDGKLDSEWMFESFVDFVKMHLDDYNDVYEFESMNRRDQVVITKNLGYNYGFVNGAVCSAGTHINKIHTQVVNQMLALLKEKDIELITANDIKKEYSIFVMTTVLNPDYDAQSKDNLTNKIPSNILSLSKEFLDKFRNSEILKRLVDYYNIKYLKEQKAALRKLNSELKKTKSKKLIKCNVTNPTMTELWLFEGDSASGGFRKARNPDFQAAYLLRGKVKNTYLLTKEEIVKNVEFREILATLGLQFNDPKGNIKNCKFKRIVIACDADHDGAHITGLLIVFFAKNFPELFIDGRIFRALSPIIIASKGSGKNMQERYYYSKEEFEKDEKNVKGWEIAYKKGLGGLEDHQYEYVVTEKRLEQLTLTADYMRTIEIWFAKSTEQRKAVLAQDTNIIVEDDAA